MVTIAALGRMSWEGHCEYKANLDYILRCHLNLKRNALEKK